MIFIHIDGLGFPLFFVGDTEECVGIASGTPAVRLTAFHSSVDERALHHGVDFAHSGAQPSGFRSEALFFCHSFLLSNSIISVR